MTASLFRPSIILLLLAALVGAQTVERSDLEQSLRAHVAYLASEKLEGRRTGEPGATAAAQYIEKSFAKYKLRSSALSRKGKYLQSFPYVTGVELALTGNEFNVRRPGETGVLDMLHSGYVKPVGFSINGGTAGASIVFAGYGIKAADLKFDDYSGVDAKGKLVIVLDGTPEADNPHSQFGRFEARTKALIARDHGAVGLLIISREENFENEKLARLRYDQSLGESAVPTFVISRAAASQMLAMGEADLKLLESAGASASGHNAMVNQGLAKFSRSATFSVNLQKTQADAFNVIGILPGNDPVLKDEAVVIGAHYDHLGRGGQGSLDVNSTAVHYGADDNASGTSAVLELARTFSMARSNKRTMIFIAFSGEEEGLIGSKFYVNNPVWPLDKTVAMINLDMVGRLRDQKLNVGGIGTSAEWQTLVNSKNKFPMTVSGGLGNSNWSYASNASLFKLQLNEDGFGPSDHSSFYGKKIPVLFLFTGTHNEYHKPTDTADKLNYDGIARVVWYVSEIVRSVDSNPIRPTYTVAKSSATMGRSTGFTVSLGTVPSYGDSTDGMLLDGVRDNSPAAKAGLKPGDKIVKLAGKDVRNVMDYTYILGEMKAGEEYEVVAVRGTEKLTLKIIPIKR